MNTPWVDPSWDPERDIDSDDDGYESDETVEMEDRDTDIIDEEWAVTIVYSHQ